MRPDIERLIEEFTFDGTPINQTLESDLIRGEFQGKILQNAYLVVASADLLPVIRI